MIKKTNKIVFQGVHGAHSDLACRKAFPYMETIAVNSFDKAMKMVEDAEADLCMIPIENSQAGRVAEIHNLLPETNLHIVGEYFQRIEHHLMAPKGADIKKINKVFSHPQALMQCRKNINQLGYETEAFYNTAGAAEHVAKLNDPSNAALASELAAELYGLEILKKDMQDADDNITVFVAMSAEPADVDYNPKSKEKIITSILFTARNIPAALYKSLGGFATNHVNLLKIESYIPAGSSKTAQFFINFEGHPQKKSVQLALEELGFFSKKIKVLGVFPASEDR
ncbi:prephenate dehydratase [Rickettsiales bacterium]|nr:prephenate dehydratase [Rickettsiales bacterium]